MRSITERRVAAGENIRDAQPCVIVCAHNGPDVFVRAGGGRHAHELGCHPFRTPWRRADNSTGAAPGRARTALWNVHRSGGGEGRFCVERPTPRPSLQRREEDATQSGGAKGGAPRGAGVAARASSAASLRRAPTRSHAPTLRLAARHERGSHGYQRPHGQGPRSPVSDARQGRRPA